MALKIMLIIASEPGAGKETEYNEWYTGKHIPIMFGFKGLKKASRYRRKGGDKKCSKYLAIYEFDSEEDLAAFSRSPEFATAVEDFDGKWRDGGFESKWNATYELIKTWEQ